MNKLTSVCCFVLIIIILFVIFYLTKDNSEKEPFVISSPTTGIANILSAIGLAKPPTYVDWLGPTGNTGPTGPTGLRGLTGAVGPIGPTGLQGLQGIQGIQGIAGPIGPTGLRGLTGAVGPIGPTGLQGLQGIQGIQGDTGPTGLQGIQGIPGVRGDTGPIGPIGPMGLTGPTGAKGQGYVAQAEPYIGNINILDANNNPVIVGVIENGIAVANGNVVRVSGTLTIQASANVNGYVLLPLPPFNVINDAGLSGTASTKFAYFNSQVGSIYYDSSLMPNYIIVSLNVKADNNVYNNNKYYQFEYGYFTDIFSNNLSTSISSQLASNYRVNTPTTVGSPVTMSYQDITSPTFSPKNAPLWYFKRGTDQIFRNNGFTTNNCLTYSSATNGAPVSVGNCSTSPAWTIDNNGKIVSQKDTNMCLAVNNNATTAGTSLVINTCNDSANGQKWRLDTYQGI